MTDYEIRAAINAKLEDAGIEASNLYPIAEDGDWWVEFKRLPIYGKTEIRPATLYKRLAGRGLHVRQHSIANGGAPHGLWFKVVAL